MPKGEKKARYPELAESARRMIEEERLTQQETGRRLGVHKTTIEHWCKRFGWKTQRTGPRSGPLHTGWKGGVHYLKGYRYIYNPDHPRATKAGFVSEHRLVYEAKIGRYLLPSEVVHHIDGNPLNNDPVNLQHFQTNGHHLAHELTGRCPRWTEDGKRRIAEGIQRRIANQRRSKSDAGPSIPSTDRQPS
jgi:hypothetical protein